MANRGAEVRAMRARKKKQKEKPRTKGHHTPSKNKQSTRQSSSSSSSSSNRGTGSSSRGNERREGARRASNNVASARPERKTTETPKQTNRPQTRSGAILSARSGGNQRRKGANRVSQNSSVKVSNVVYKAKNTKAGHVADTTTDLAKGLVKYTAQRWAGYATSAANAASKSAFSKAGTGRGKGGGVAPTRSSDRGGTAQDKLRDKNREQRAAWDRKRKAVEESGYSHTVNEWDPKTKKNKKKTVEYGGEFAKADKKLEGARQKTLEKATENLSGKATIDIPKVVDYIPDKLKPFVGLEGIESSEKTRKKAKVRATLSSETSKIAAITATVAELSAHGAQEGFTDDTVLTNGQTWGEYRRSETKKAIRKIVAASDKARDEAKKNAESLGKISQKDVGAMGITMGSDLVDYLIPMGGTNRLFATGVEKLLAKGASKGIGKAALTTSVKGGGKVLTKEGLNVASNVVDDIVKGAAKESAVSATTKKILRADLKANIKRELLVNAMQDATIGTTIDAAKGKEMGLEGKDFWKYMGQNAVMNAVVGAPVSLVAGRTPRAARNALKGEIAEAMNNVSLTRAEGLELVNLNHKIESPSAGPLTKAESARYTELLDKARVTSEGVATVSNKGRVVAAAGGQAKEALTSAERAEFFNLKAQEAAGMMTTKKVTRLGELNAKIARVQVENEIRAQNIVSAAEANVERVTAGDLGRIREAEQHYEALGMDAEVKRVKAVREKAEKVFENKVADINKAANKFTKMTGKSVHIDSSDEIVEAYSRLSGKAAASIDSTQLHGFAVYDKDGNVIEYHVNKDSAQAMEYTLGHELTHGFEVLGEDYDNFVKALKEYVGDDWDTELERVKQNYDGLCKTEVEFEKETVANLVGKYLFDGEGQYLKHIQEKDASLFGKIYNFIKKIIGRTREIDEDLQALNEKLDDMFGKLSTGERALVESQPEGVKWSFGGEDSIISRLAEGDNPIALKRAEDYISALDDLRWAQKQFAGDYDKLVDARMKIFKRFHWYQGYDGKWRYEIDDSKMKFRWTNTLKGGAKDTNGNPRLAYFDSKKKEFRVGDNDDYLKAKAKLDELAADGVSSTDDEYKRIAGQVMMYEAFSERGTAIENVIDHQELFALFPELTYKFKGNGEGLMVKFRGNDSCPDANIDKDGNIGSFRFGYYDSTDGSIVINAHLLSDKTNVGKAFKQSGVSRGNMISEVLVHEVQHILQRKEGFARGVSEAFYAQYPDSVPRNFELDADKVFEMRKKELEILAGFASFDVKFLRDFQNVLEIVLKDNDPSAELKDASAIAGRANIFRQLDNKFRENSDGAEDRYVKFIYDSITDDTDPSGIYVLPKNETYEKLMKEFIRNDYRKARLTEPNPFIAYSETAGEIEAKTATARMYDDGKAVSTGRNKKNYPLEEGAKVRFAETQYPQKGTTPLERADELFPDRLTKNEGGTARIHNADIPDEHSKAEKEIREALKAKKNRIALSTGDNTSETAKRALLSEDLEEEFVAKTLKEYDDVVDEHGDKIVDDRLVRDAWNGMKANVNESIKDWVDEVGYDPMVADLAKDKESFIDEIVDGLDDAMTSDPDAFGGGYYGYLGRSTGESVEVDPTDILHSSEKLVRDYIGREYDRFFEGGVGSTGKTNQDITKEYVVDTDGNVTKEADDDYMGAVDSGDIARAQKLVNTVLEARGYDIDAYHGSDTFGFTEFSLEGMRAQDSQNKYVNVFAAKSPKTASTYIDHLNDTSVLPIAAKTENASGGAGGVYHAKLKMDNPLVVDAHGGRWNGIKGSDVLKNVDAETDTPQWKALKDAEANFRNSYKTYTSDGITLSDTLDDYDLMDALLTATNFARAAENVSETGFPRLPTNLQDFIEEGHSKVKVFEEARGPSAPRFEEALREYVEYVRDAISDFNRAHVEHFTTIDSKGTYRTREVMDFAKAHGYDGVVFKELNDFGPNMKGDEEADDIYIVFNSEQFKSADPVTFDANGEVIPLSQRGLEENPDIRFSVGEAGGGATKEPAKKPAKAKGTAQKATRPMELKGVIDRAKRTAKAEDMNQTAINMINKDMETYGGMKGYKDIIEEDARKGMFGKFKAMDNKKAAEAAQAELRDIGYEDMLAKFMSTDFNEDPNMNTERALALMNERNRMLEAGEGDESQLLADFTNITSKMSSYSGFSSKVMSAMKKFVTATPEGRIRTVRQEIERLERRYKDRIKGGKLNIDDAKLEALINAKGAERDKILHEINIELWEQIPASFMERLNEYRHCFMLFNVKTHGRNVFGNSVFRGFRFLSDEIEAAMLNSGAAKKRVAKLEGKNVDDVVLDKAHVSFADVRDNNDYLTSEFHAIYDTSGSTNKFIEMARPVEVPAAKFKPMQKLIALNYKALEVEDLKGALIPAFNKAYAGYCKSRCPKDVELREFMESMTDAEKEAARRYALAQGEYATFRDSCAFSEWLIGKKQTFAGKRGKSGSRWSWGTLGYRSLDAVLEGTIPFVNTPVNIFRRSVDYSPASIVFSIGKLARASTAEEFKYGVHQLSTGLTGTGVFGMGVLLSHFGLMTVKAGEESGDEYYDRDMGFQDYSLKISLGGKEYSWTLDWLAPVNMSLFAGAAFDKAFDKEGFDEQASLNALFAITSPMTDMSFMSSPKDTVQRFMENVSRGNKGEEADWGGALAQLILGDLPKNFISGFAPQLTAQLAGFLDPVQRDTRGTSENVFVRGWESAGKQLANKVPFLRQTILNPKIDRRGNDKRADVDTGNNVVTKMVHFANSFVNPSNVKEITFDDTDRELINIRNHMEDKESDDYRYFFYNFTGAPKYGLNAKVNGRTRMTSREAYLYGKQNRIMQNDIINDMVSSPSYEYMKDKGMWDMAAQEVDKAHWIGTTHADYKTYGPEYAMKSLLKNEEGEAETVKEYKRLSKESGKTDTKALDKTYLKHYVNKERLISRSHADTDDAYRLKALTAMQTGDKALLDALDIKAGKLKDTKKYWDAVKEGKSTKEARETAFKEISDYCCRISANTKKAGVKNASRGVKSLSAGMVAEDGAQFSERVYRGMGHNWNSAQAGAGLRLKYNEGDKYSIEKIQEMKSTIRTRWDLDDSNSVNKKEVVAYIKSLKLGSADEEACLYEVLYNGGKNKNPFKSQIDDHLKWRENHDEDADGSGWGRRGRRRRRRRRRGGRGGGGGGSAGGTGTPPKTATGAFEGKITDVTKGSGGSGKSIASAENVVVKSNLNDAYRKKAKKLRDAQRR